MLIAPQHRDAISMARAPRRGHGSTAQAAVSALSPVRQAIDRMPQHPRYSVLHGGVDALRRAQGYPLQPGAIGLACGAAIGILIGIAQALWSNHLRARMGG